MGLLSILPESFSAVETWLTRIFLILGTIIIGPWLLILVYDILLYLWRSATYELPFLGGRARGKGRPRAPSLAERPDGSHRRQISVPGLSRHGDGDVVMTGATRDSMDPGLRKGFQTVIEDD